MSLQNRIEAFWYSNKKPIWPLQIPSFLYAGAVAIRRWFYQIGLFPTTHFPVPVIVVGNMTVGGTGKTPLVIHIANLLRERGFHPGIVSRGYKGSAEGPILVEADSDPSVVGDEPIIMARHLSCPVVVGKDRAKAVQFLLGKDLAKEISGENESADRYASTDRYAITHVISDDGLQHYAMDRAIEIAVIDGARRFGNGLCLPMGPLREPKDRLKCFNLVITQGEAEAGEYDMIPQLKGIYCAFNENSRKENSSNENSNKEIFKSNHLEQFRGKTVHAVAGIANPDRFFSMLQNEGIQVIPHPFPDHHNFTQKDLDLSPDYPIIMTEKDWVKCQSFPSFSLDRLYVAKMKLQVNPLFDARLLLMLEELRKGNIE